MNQRARSSAAWFKRLAVWALSTPSRCTCAASDAEGRLPFVCVIAAVTKFTRSTTVLEEIHDSLLGQPFTSGGSNRDCPIPDPDEAMTLPSFLVPSAREAPSMNSAGDFTNPR